MPHTRSVADEIGQSKPFAGLGQEVVVTILRTADEVRRYLGRLLAAEEVTPQQYNVLRILRGAGPEGLPTLEIGRRMLEEQPGVTRLVDRLVTKGLVDRERDDVDRRKVVCSIRQPGLALLKRVDSLMAELERDVAAGTPEDGGRGLVADLDRLRARLREPQPPASTR